MNRLAVAIRQVGVLSRRELRQLARSGTTVGLIIIGPVLAAVIASAALGQPPKVHAVVAVHGVPTDVGDATALAQLASEAPGASLRWQLVPTEATARAMVRDGRAAAALLLPEGSPPHPSVTVIVNRHSPIPAALVVSAGHTLAARIAATTGRAPSAASAQLVVASPGRRSLNGAELYGPVVAIFFLFLASGFVARGLQAERERGTLARLRAMPIASGAIVTSKLVTTFVIGVVEFTAVLATMSAVYGARWGNLLALSIVVIALTLAVGAVALVVASFARTPQAAYQVGMLIALALGALGGNLVPLQNLPEAARTIADITPNGVAIHTMRGIAAHTVSISEIAAPVGAILAFAFVVGALGYFNVRRVVEA